MGTVTAIAGRLWMMSFQACALILIVLAVRILLKKFPKSYSYFLWALVGARLLCPVFIEAPFSLQPEIWDFSGTAQLPDGMGSSGTAQPPDGMSPSGTAQPPENMHNVPSGFLGGHSGAGREPGHLAGTLSEGREEGAMLENPSQAYGSVAGQMGTTAGQEGRVMQDAGTSQNPGRDGEAKKDMLPYSLLALLYLAGVAAAFCAYFTQYFLVKRCIRMAVREEGNVWLCEKVRTPFVFGMARSRIILPFTLQKEEKIYILKHERVHIKHHDPIFRFFGILCICLHWWNPFVWLAVHRMNQDMEMYCDEAVLRGATTEEKKSYARTLLSFAQKQSGLAVGLAFGESNTERRVKNIMYKRKGSIAIIGIVVLLSVFCIATLMTIPGSADGKEIFSGGQEGQKSPEGGMPDTQGQPEGNEGEDTQDQPGGNGAEDTQGQPEGNKAEGAQNQPEGNEAGGLQSQPEGDGLEKEDAANADEGQDAYLYTESLAFAPYGEVTFAVAAPDSANGPCADMEFCLLQAGEEVYAFLPNGKEIREDRWEFQRISEVKLQDINQDNITDLITVAEYCWGGSDWSEACIYTGTDDGKFIEEIYLEEAYNQSHKEKSVSELLEFIKENRDYYIYASIYGSWSVTEYIPQEGFGAAGQKAALSEEEAQSLVGAKLEYGRYYYIVGQQSYLVDSYSKELVTAREFDARMGVTTGELGLAAVALHYYELKGVAGLPFGSCFYQIDAENALVYHQGAFFRAVRKAAAVRDIGLAWNAEDGREPDAAGQEGQPAGNLPSGKEPDMAGQEGQPAENLPSVREQMISAYIAALEELYEDQVLPDGEGRSLWDSDSIEDNHFAVYDVDGDGMEELIIQYTTTYVAGQTEGIYSFDPASGTLRQKLLEYPALSYYSNGTVIAELSHNHGMAAGGEHDFWPYQIYRYNPASGVYEWQANVDAWDKSFRARDDQGNAFPDEFDLDKDGMLYSLSGQNGFYDRESWDEILVDGEAYEEWLDSYLGDAKQLSIPYVRLTKENIHALR